jgi:hypothetical protein
VAVVDVPDGRSAAGGHEGEGEVGGVREHADVERGGVGREGWVEAVVVEEVEEWWGVEAAEYAEEGLVGDESAEGDARGGGAREVFWAGSRRKISNRRWLGISVRGDAIFFSGRSGCRAAGEEEPAVEGEIGRGSGSRRALCGNCCCSDSPGEMDEE